MANINLGPDGIGSGSGAGPLPPSVNDTWVPHTRLLSITDISNGYIDLPDSPITAISVLCDSSAGFFKPGADFSISGSRVSWNIGGSLLLATLRAGDTLLISYEKA